MTSVRLVAMKQAAQAEFATAPRERGTEPSRFDLLVHIDELVGPMAFVVETVGELRHWPLPAFQTWLSSN